MLLFFSIVATFPPTWTIMTWLHSDSDTHVYTLKVLPFVPYTDVVFFFKFSLFDQRGIQEHSPGLLLPYVAVSSTCSHESFKVGLHREARHELLFFFVFSLFDHRYVTCIYCFGVVKKFEDKKFVRDATRTFCHLTVWPSVYYKCNYDIWGMPNVKPLGYKLKKLSTRRPAWETNTG